MKDEYDSTPGYWEAEELSPPAGGDAEALCAAFGAMDAASVESVLRKTFQEENDYVFAVMRHAALVAALGIPDFAVGTAYASFEHDEYPEGLSADDVLRTA